MMFMACPFLHPGAVAMVVDKYRKVVKVDETIR